MKEKFNGDIVINVLAKEKSKGIVDHVLNEFIPNYEKLNHDYACPPGKKEYEFNSEEEMVNFFIENKGISQSFYWNKYEDNPDKVMVGVSITIDDKLIISLTFNGTKETEANYFLRLKNILNSDVGEISYIDPPEYEDGEDFIKRYGSKNTNLNDS